MTTVGISCISPVIELRLQVRIMWDQYLPLIMIGVRETGQQPG